MKKLVSELEGPELDYFVAKARGWELSERLDASFPPAKIIFEWLRKDGQPHIKLLNYSPHSNSAQAMELVKEFDVWLSSDKTEPSNRRKIASCSPHMNDAIQYGPTPEVAICRAVCAAVFGEYVDGE